MREEQRFIRGFRFLLALAAFMLIGLIIVGLITDLI